MTKYTDTGKKDTRSGFGAGLYEAGKADSRVVALTADLKGSLKMDAFANDFPERFIQCGIAESNMIGVAAGLAITGKIPFAGSFAEFVTGRVYDQIRQEVAYGQTNVKIAASHAGITLGEDGATHQTMEDIALMRALPGMVVINPCDYNQTKAATIAAAKYDGPVYLRFGRPSVPNFTPEDQTFEIGKAYVMNEGKDVTIIATGHLVWEALKAAEILENEGICAEVIDIASILSIDVGFGENLTAIGIFKTTIEVFACLRNIFAKYVFYVGGSREIFIMVSEYYTIFGGLHIAFKVVSPYFTCPSPSRLGFFGSPKCGATVSNNGIEGYVVTYFGHFCRNLLNIDTFCIFFFICEFLVFTPD